jgi:type I restriction enzyme, S subunit
MTKIIKYKFCDLYDMSSGISSKPEQAGHGFPFLSFSCVFNNQFLPESLPDLMDTSEKERNTYSIKKGDIFLTRTSETLDELGLSSVALEDITNATYSGFLKRLRAKQTDVSYHKFMAFYLRSNLFRKTMNNNAIMTLRASLNEQIFSYLDLLLPEFKEQKKIGDYLYLINQKIEMNNKINKKLEAMAKLIYEYWFVQFDFPDTNGKPYKSSGGKMIYHEALNREIPEEWEVCPISSKMKIASGHPFVSNNYLNSGFYKVITIKNVQDDGLNTLKVDFLNNIPSGMESYCMLESKDILMSLTGNVGRLCLVNEENLLLNQRVGKFLTDSKYKNYLYLTYLSPEFRIWLERIASGSSQDNLSPIDAVEKLHAFPNLSNLKKFNQILDPLINQIILNSRENKKLIELIDWLFPMLMNGQVTVKDS